MASKPQPVEIATPIPACDSCGNSGDGIDLEEFEDEGDPSVGYGPLTLTYCPECSGRIGAAR